MRRPQPTRQRPLDLGNPDVQVKITLPIIAIVKLIQLLGVLNLNENFSQLLQPAKTFKFFLETLSCNSSMNQPNCTISIIIRATRFTDHHQQQPQQQQRLTSNATASTLELVSAYLATLRLEFDSFHLYSTPMLQQPNTSPTSATTTRIPSSEKKFRYLYFLYFKISKHSNVLIMHVLNYIVPIK